MCSLTTECVLLLQNVLPNAQQRVLVGERERERSSERETEGRRDGGMEGRSVCKWERKSAREGESACEGERARASERARERESERARQSAPGQSTDPYVFLFFFDIVFPSKCFFAFTVTGKRGLCEPLVMTQIVLQKVRMCSLTTECVFLLQNVLPNAQIALQKVPPL